jgi:KaiC/GvpD/RAD55 family RecA-like ATPase
MSIFGTIYVVGNPLSVIEISGDVLDIALGLDQIQYGDHVLLIYPNMDSIREIYSHYSRAALENGESVLLLNYYETADNTRQTMKEIGIDVGTYEKEGRLMIVVV